MIKVLTPEKAIIYCTIVLSELSLDPRNENSIISSEYIHIDFAGVSMPPVQVDGFLSEEQLSLINGLCEQNRKSSMFRFAKMLHHFRRKISRCLNSRTLSMKQHAWLRDPDNVDIDVKYSPRVTAEERLRKWAKRVSDQAVPGIVGKSYSEYLEGVYDRLV
jgi:hypothetical protein